jgi:hypothetical protein
VDIHDRYFFSGLLGGNEMPVQSIQSITRAAFEELHPDRATTSVWFQQEVEWFVERSRLLIGCIAKNVQSDDWLFVVQGRDECGRFHEIETQAHLATQEEARNVFRSTVSQLVATGVKVFP